VKIDSLILTLIFCLLNLPAKAEIYKWVDENGKVHFSDKKPENDKTATKTIKSNNNYNSGSNVKAKTAIPYINSTPAKKIKLDSVELKLKGASYKDIKIGRLMSGDYCSKKVTDIVWTDGDQFLDANGTGKIFSDEFDRAGYSLSIPGVSSQHRARLFLKVELTKIRLDRCIDKRNRSKSRNNIYLKLNWLLEDRLARKQIFKGESEGAYQTMSLPFRVNGTEQALDRAFAVAVNNLLAKPSFVELLNGEKQNTLKETSFSNIPVALRYSTTNSSFKSKLKRLQKSTVTVRTTEGHGSGFLISNNGHILTNAHVVGNEDRVIVILNDRELEASVVRVEPIRDVALIKVNKRLVTIASEISQQTPEVGDDLFVIGTPLSESLSHTVTSGIVSAKRIDQGLTYYQTDASINPGNSGGPIYNKNGDLVAMSVSGVFSKSGAGLGLNYLIPIEDALDALNITKASISSTAIDKDQTTRKSLSNESLFNLYQKALTAKQNKQFDTAQGLLERAIVGVEPKSKSEEITQINDELYFFLPMARAQHALKLKDTDSAEKIITSLNGYIKNHPKRFEYARQLNDLSQVVSYTKGSLDANSQSELFYIKAFLSEVYAIEGSLPKTLQQMKILLSQRFGRKLSNSYRLLKYSLDKGNIQLIFKNLNTNREITISGNI